MMPLSEIRRMKDSVDADWCSTVADQAAQVWGLDAGSARWWRSSASHVFVVPGEPRRFLRFVPEGTAAAFRLRGGAQLADSFPVTDGLWIARPLPAESGQLVPTVDTGFGPMAAMLVDEAPGEALEVSSLSPERAQAWGQALASFHEAAVTADGITLHGDFELDNLRFTDRGVAIFDLDEARSGTAAEDVALATRALRGDEGDSPEPLLYAAFLRGYRSRRGFTPAEEAAVPEYALQYSARRVASEPEILDDGGSPLDPAWLRDLHNDIRTANNWHREQVRNAAFVPEGN